MENVRCYHDKLSDEEVFTCFNNIITKSKKFAKVELKVSYSNLLGYSKSGTNSFEFVV